MHTAQDLSNFKKIQFLVPIFGRGATPALGDLELWKPQMGGHNYTQLITQN